jgi:hypothetical protein
MRHHEAGFIPPLSPIQDQVKIECPGRPRRRPFAPVFALNLQQPFEQLTGRQPRVANHDPVQKARLLTHANGGGVVPTRVTEVVENAGQAADGEGEVGFAIAEVAAQGDRDANACRGLRGYCPVQRAPMTTPS